MTASLTGSRAYDGTTNAAAAIISVANPVGGDNVTVASGDVDDAGHRALAGDPYDLAVGRLDRHQRFVLLNHPIP